MTRARRSLVSRLGLATFAAITVSSATVAGITGTLAQRFARQRESAQLRGAATTLAVELREAGAEPLAVAEDETRELAHTGIRIAIYEGERFIAGDEAVSLTSAGTCRDGDALQSCAEAAGRWTAVTARDHERLDEQRETFLLAALLAILVTGLLGGLAARSIALWGVAPLSRLRRRVESIEDDGVEANLGEDEGVIEVDALRTAFDATLKRLGQSLGQSRRFAADAAHELRTPLTSVIGEIDLAREADPAEQRAALERARRNAARLAVLVDRLLVLARPAAALEAVESVAILDLIEDALAGSPQGRARVETVCPAELTVEGDRALLVSMLANGIENALKFSGAAVQVSAEPIPDGVRVTIDDEGPGVPASERDRVFEPFYRTRDGRCSGVPGHGIGLALIAHVAALHGGSARFAEVPRGARLEIELPLAGRGAPKAVAKTQ